MPNIEEGWIFGWECEVNESSRKKFSPGVFDFCSLASLRDALLVWNGFRWCRLRSATGYRA